MRVSTFTDLLVLVLITVEAVGELGLQGGAGYLGYLGVLESRLFLQFRHPPLQSPQSAQRLSSLKARSSCRSYRSFLQSAGSWHSAVGPQGAPEGCTPVDQACSLS